jgi:GT2 family glycosyltransferase
VLAVVVLYRRAPHESGAWPTLMHWLEAPERSGLCMRHVLFHDNSPTPSEPRALSTHPQTTYHHDPANGGTRGAFLQAAAVAEQLGCEWLLLLDQDTLLPHALLSAASTSLTDARQAAALLPRVLHQQTPVSPAVIGNTGIVRPLPLSELPPAGVRVTAIASGTLLRTNALRELGDIPPSLWLDGLDHWIFTRLHQRHRSVHLIDCTLQHDLSVADVGSMPPWRVVNMLQSERELLRELPLLARLIYPYRLARYLSRLRREHPDAARAAWRWLVTGQMPARPAPPSLSPTVPDTSQMAFIDILLPVYNGEPYLTAQLDSLLSQTHTEWRCIVRDDGSRDGSMEIVRRYREAHPERFLIVDDALGNLGTVRCLNVLGEHVTAPVFAFCDQDDVWQPHKLATSLSTLEGLKAPVGTPALVYCDMTVTDTALTPTAASFWDIFDGRPYARNLSGLPIINVVAGCTMVGNRALLDAAFPVPDCAPMHDYWVGIVAKFTGALAAIETPLMLYRQHGRNQCGVGARPSLPSRMLSRLGALSRFREQARRTRALRRAMLEALLERRHPALDLEACHRALRAEQGGMTRRLCYLWERGIRPDHAFIYWLA